MFALVDWLWPWLTCRRFVQQQQQLGHLLHQRVFGVYCKTIFVLGAFDAAIFL